MILLSGCWQLMGHQTRKNSTRTQKENITSSKYRITVDGGERGKGTRNINNNTEQNKTRDGKRPRKREEEFSAWAFITVEEVRKSKLKQFVFDDIQLGFVRGM